MADLAGVLKRVMTIPGLPGELLGDLGMFNTLFLPTPANKPEFERNAWVLADMLLLTHLRNHLNEGWAREASAIWCEAFASQDREYQARRGS